MKMHEIKVDDEVFEYLQRKAVPLVDTPNSVLRRVLFGRKRDGRASPALLRGWRSPAIHLSKSRAPSLRSWGHTHPCGATA